MAGIGLFVASDPVVAVLCGLAAAGLMLPRLRGIVAVAVLCALAYHVSDRRLHGVLDTGLWWLLPVATMALFIAWPRLIEERETP